MFLCSFITLLFLLCFFDISLVLLDPDADADALSPNKTGCLLLKEVVGDLEINMLSWELSLFSLNAWLKFDLILFS